MYRKLRFAHAPDLPNGPIPLDHLSLSDPITLLDLDGPVSDALADGTATAKNLRARFTDLRPEQIASDLCLPIETTDVDPLVGSIWRFAEYRP